ncbi:hypothetical protein HII28_09535 [Planctomonas sp. JC2975]|nr:hypothetical protein [Planctomonas sp. JC2975]
MLRTEPTSISDIQLPYLRAAHVQPRGVLIEAEEKRMWFSATEAEANDLRAGDIVVVEGGAGYGRSAVLAGDRPGWGFQNSIVRLRPKTGLADGGFINYALQAALRSGQIANFVSTATIPHFTAEKVAALPVPMPSLDEQRRIADYLDDQLQLIDSVRLRRARQLTLLDEKLAQHFGMSVANCEWKPLKRFGVRVEVGIVIQPARWYTDESGIPAVRGTDISPGHIAMDNLVSISREGHEANLKSELHAGDVVVVRTGQAGAAAVVPSELNCANAIDILIVRPGPDLLPKFLELLINSERARKFVAEFSVGSLQAHFNVAMLREMPVPTMPTSAQQRAIDEVSALQTADDRLAAAISRQLELLDEHRNAMINAAVSGAFDVTTARRVA